jgi:hypothetical protein
MRSFLLQETTVLVTQSDTGSQRVMLWGGYQETAADKPPQLTKHEQEQFQSELLEDFGCCYKRSVFIYEDGVWRYLQRLGDAGPPMAQGYAVQVR